jgi:DNA-binding beta-propeller fold protein YncE
MGLVLKARDPALGRTVAVKVLSPGLSYGAAARRRFAREARAVAAVGHEHIVAIHAVDEFRGLPYLVMEYVPGRSLQQKLDAAGPLEVREILRIGTQAARALAAAHAQGVVHRDIKPANILLENCVERVKLTDFGLARAMDDASLTQSGLIAGTPQYMAPEQARGEPVDARADLFALGSALYATAAGRSPFRADSAMAVLKRVCDERHRPLRELNSDVPDWLEAVIDRLLAKEPSDRFQTAAEVADLLENGLAHLQQPMTVPPPIIPGFDRSWEKGRDLDAPAPAAWPRRLRRLPIAAAVVLLIVAGLGASEAAGLTWVSEFVATILRIALPDGTLLVKVDDPEVKVRVDGDEVTIAGAGPQEVRLRPGRHRFQAFKDGKAVRDQLVTITKGGKEIVNIEFEARIQDARPAAVPYHPGHPPDPAPGHVAARREAQPPGAVGPGNLARVRGLVWSLAFSPDGRRVAIGQQGIDRPESILRVWDPAQRSDTAWFQHPAGYRSVAFSSDGRTLAAANFDGTLRTYHYDGAWNDRLTENQGSPINSLVFLPGSATIAAGSWDGWVRFHGPDADANRRPIQYPGQIWSLAVSPDGSTLAVGGAAKTIQVYDLPTRRLKAIMRGHDHDVASLDFSPDGKWLASAGGRTVLFWDTATWAAIGGPIQHAPEVISVRFSPDGRILAIADGESALPHYKYLETSIILWDVAAGAEVRRLRGHTNTIWALAFSPDGKTLASGSADQTVKFWDLASGHLMETIVPGESGTSAGMGAVSERGAEAGAGPGLSR